MSAFRWKLLATAAVFAGTVVFTAPPAVAVAPDSVSFTLEGCRQEGLPAGYDLEGAGFLCDEDDNPAGGDTADEYTTGNLGKLWNELDLVPHRVTTNAGNAAPATQTYNVAITADHEDIGEPGYDVITLLNLNLDLSDGSCMLTDLSAAFPAGEVLDPGVGGTDKSLYRLLEITQDKNTTCVIDYVQRLAVGSHNFPGSSLHSNLLNENFEQAGIGNKDVPLPVMEILPQTIAKEMDAIQDGDHTWSIAKQADPGNLVFTDTCEDVAPDPQAVTLTVTWTRSAVIGGEVMVTADITATNPANRIITVAISDEIFGNIGAGNVSLDVFGCAPVNVPAQSANFPVCSHMFNAPVNVTDLNDVATATYTDLATGIPVPGTTEATASTDIQPGSFFNTTADITDSEFIITPSGDIEFSVESFAGPGAFNPAYAFGTKTTGPVDWEALDQPDSGQVVFEKLVHAEMPTIVTETLHDDAFLLASDGVNDSAQANVTIQAFALFDLTINKTIPDVLQGAETESFDFEVSGPDAFFQVVTLNFAAGDTSKSDTLFDLEPGAYTVHEVPNPPWNVLGDEGVIFPNTDITLADCLKEVTFDNDFPPADARVIKTCIGPGPSGDFDITLAGPGGPETLEDVQCGQDLGFALVLQEGDYEVTEVVPDGWVQTGATNCTFNVDYPDDSGTTFICQLENTQLGRIIIDKVTDPSGDGQLFEFDLTGGPSGLAQNFFLADATTPHDSGFVLPGNGYVAAETVPAGWDLTSATCDDGSPVGNIDVSPGETVTCTFTNTKRGKIIIKKLTDPPGDPETFDFAGDVSGTLSDMQTAMQEVTPGQYTSTETLPADTADAIWELISVVCDDGNSTGDIPSLTATFNVEPGEEVTCTFTNRKTIPTPGTIRIIKQSLNGAGAFDYTSTGGSNLLPAFSLNTAVDGNPTVPVDPTTGLFINMATSLIETTVYTVTEELPLPGFFNFVSLDCVDENAIGVNVPSTDSGRTATINLDDGETVTCTYVNEMPPDFCRVTAGGVDKDGNIIIGANATSGTWRFGGQAGARSAIDDPPSGEWTHMEKGDFTFHGGTRSASDGTTIVDIRCTDPPAIHPARANGGFKQIDFDGIGEFENVKKGSPLDGVVTPAKGKGTATLHWFEVNLDDLGEPGNFDPNAGPCPADGFGENSTTALANGQCPDYYRITIFTDATPTTILYQASGYIDGGNVQIHELTGFDRN